MLPLKHLFDDRPLAELLRVNWDADPEPFPWFRISANAVYPFSFAGEPRFLRFAPAGERQVEQLQAELDFLNYLKAAGYPATWPVPARDGRLIVEQSTRSGPYVAIVVAGVPGTPVDRTDFSDEIITAYGRALAELHLHSAAYYPPGPRRRSETDLLNWIRLELADTPTARIEADMLEARFRELPRTPETYGLIHYDFECDNVLFDAATGRCWAIDFDDSTYHWFAMDIEQALSSLDDEVKGKEQLFLDAYATVRPLPADLTALRPLCKRFGDLYWSARVRHSLAGQPSEQPDWMVTLRGKMETRLARYTARFGTPL